MVKTLDAHKWFIDNGWTLQVHWKNKRDVQTYEYMTEEDSIFFRVDNREVDFTTDGYSIKKDVLLNTVNWLNEMRWVSIIKRSDANIDKISAVLKKAGLETTMNRVNFIKTLVDANNWVSLPFVFNTLKDSGAKVNNMSVYNAAHVLEDKGIIEMKHKNTRCILVRMSRKVKI